MLYSHVSQKGGITMNIFRYVVLSVFFLSTSFAYAEEPKQPPPLDPKFMRQHKMVLMSSESDLFATFIPTLNEPNNQQLVYLVDAKGPNLFYLVRDADRVTIMTDEFNLQRLIREQSLEVNVQVYLGDITKDATPVYTDIPLNFVKQLYYRKLDDIEPSGLRQTYDVIELNSQDRMLVHRIKNAPSFDHIVLVEEAKYCVTQFFTSNALPKQEELLMKLLFCGSLKPMHFNPITGKKDGF